MKLKMWIGNLDGVRQGLVIASSKERAREIIGRCSRAEFDGFWVEQPEVDSFFETETLYTRYRDDEVWHVGRCKPRRKS